MRAANIQRLSVFFCFLIVFQEGIAFSRIKKIDAEVKKKTEPLEPTKIRAKRNLGGVLISIGTISAGLDIYKQTAGCNGFAPDLNPTVQKAKDLQASNNARASNINLEWVPIESKENYAERMATDLDIIRTQLTNIDKLKADIVTSLDPEIMDKLNEVGEAIEAGIEANEITDVGKLEDLEAKYKPAGLFALGLAVKLAPITIYLGFEGIPKLITSSTRSAARTWAAANPFKSKSLLTRYAEFRGSVWAKAKLNQFQQSLYKNWANYLHKNPELKGIITQLKNMESVQKLARGLKSIKVELMGAGTMALAGFLLAQEFVSLMNFKKGCEEKLVEAKAAYKTLVKQEKNLTNMETEMNEMLEKSNNYYNQMKGNLTNTEFLYYLKEIVDLAKNSLTQNYELKAATENIESYITEIVKTDNDDARTDALNKMLITGLSKISLKLDCLYSKVAIISTIRNDCAAGIGTFKEIFEAAQQKEQSTVFDECLNNGYMTQEEIQGTNDETMIGLGKQPECIRNSEVKQNIVCRNWQNGMSNEENMNSVGITENDLTHFISTCSLGTVSNDIIITICAKKEKGVTSEDILEEYYMLQKDSLLVEYSKCSLTEAQKTSICTSKANGFSIYDIYSKYNLYSEGDLNAAFNACALSTKVTPFDQTMICMYVNDFKIEDSDIFENYGMKYDQAALSDLIKSCKTNGQ